MVFPKWPIETCILIFLEILTHMSVIALFCVCVCVCVHRVGGNWVGGGGGSACAFSSNCNFSCNSNTEML